MVYLYKPESKVVLGNVVTIFMTSLDGAVSRKEMFYLMTHSKHFIYGYMASDIW